jgi:succinylglutamate desuccinylase
MDRIIGQYSGSAKGPLLICFGGIHGNEPAGVEALETVFAMLRDEPRHNPGFHFTGRIVGLRGNRPALAVGTRYFDEDLNRLWTPSLMAELMDKDIRTLHHERREIRELMELIQEQLKVYQPKRMVVLDLHTTTAEGGIFVIASDDPDSLDIAREMHAPVITGMLQGLQGTMLHYFNAENFDFPVVALGFEAGQHQDPLSVNRCIAAIINCLRTIGCVRADDVEHRHDELLKNFSKGLPTVAALRYVHRIGPDDEFRMEPGFVNFQRVRKGQVLAHDRRGAIPAPMSGHILMPLYQPQGNDGFFIVSD